MQGKGKIVDQADFEQILSLERLITIGRLTPSVLHEINNPLQAIRGALQLAQDDIDKPEELHEYISICQQEIEHITRLVSQMRLIYRSQSNEPKAFQLTELMRNAVTLTQEEAMRQKVKVHNNLPSALPLVYGVFDQIYIAILRALLILIDVIGQVGGGELAITAGAVVDRIRITFRTDNPIFLQEPGSDRLTSQELLEQCQLVEASILIAANGGDMGFQWSDRGALLCIDIVEV